jgi:hypothetical protein
VNQISDISPLEQLIDLRHLALENNQISDIKPLVDNPGIGPRDILILDKNPLSPESIDVYIPQFRARGVSVW